MKIEITVEHLKQRHLNDIVDRLQPTQADMREFLTNGNDYARSCRLAGPCGAFVHDGKTVACAGLIDFEGTGRAIVWILLANDIRRIFSPLLRKMMRSLAKFPRRRIEAHIAPDWKEAKRLVSAVGFAYEGLMRAHETDGSDRELWAMVGGSRW